MEDSQSTGLDISQLPPFFSADNVDDFEKPIAEGVKKIVVGYFIRFAISSMANSRSLTFSADHINKFCPRTSHAGASEYSQVIHPRHGTHVPIRISGLGLCLSEKNLRIHCTLPRIPLIVLSRDCKEFGHGRDCPSLESKTRISQMNSLL